MADEFEVFADRFLSGAQQYCAEHTANESTELASTKTLFKKITTEMAPLDLGGSADKRILVLQETSSIHYHAAPLTSNLNDAGKAALGIVNKMRADAGGTVNNIWWLTFSPAAGPQAKEWKFERAELQEEGGARAVENNSEWVHTVLQQYLNKAQQASPITATAAATATRADKTNKPAQQQSGSNTNTIGLTEQGYAFVVRTPQALCCNCGSKSGLSSIPTTFIRDLKFSTRFEQEFSFDLDLPYCKPCSAKVGKYPMSGAFKFFIGFCLWFVSFFAMAILFNNPLRSHTQQQVFSFFALVVPVVLVFGIFHLLNKPKAPQTSRYLPVKIKEFSRRPDAIRNEGRQMLLVTAIAAVVGAIYKRLSQSDTNQIKRLSMRFSNMSYAKLFYKENVDLIKKGSIRIL